MNDLLKTLSIVKKELNDRKQARHSQQPSPLCLRKDDELRASFRNASPATSSTSSVYYSTPLKRSPSAFGRKKLGLSMFSYGTPARLRSYKLDAVKLLDSRVKGFLAKHMRIWKKSIENRKEPTAFRLQKSRLSLSSTSLWERRSTVAFSEESSKVTLPASFPQFQYPTKSFRPEIQNAKAPREKYVKSSAKTFKQNTAVAKLVKVLVKPVAKLTEAVINKLNQGRLSHRTVGKFVQVLRQAALRWSFRALVNRRSRRSKRSITLPTKIKKNAAMPQLLRLCGQGMAKTLSTVTVHVKRTAFETIKEASNLKLLLRNLRLEETLKSLINRKMKSFFQRHQTAARHSQALKSLKNGQVHQGLLRLNKLITRKRTRSFAAWKAISAQTPKYKMLARSVSHVLIHRQSRLSVQFWLRLWTHIKNREKAIHSLREVFHRHIIRYFTVLSST